MTVKSGLGASIGVATESTYGTYAAVNRFFPFTDEGLKLDQEYVESGGLQAGVLAQNAGLVEQTTRRATGTVELDVLTKGMGVLLNQLHGNTVTPTGAGTAKTQVHEIGETAPDGKSLSLQVGAPDVAGTVQPKTTVGGTVSQVELSMDTGGILKSTWTIDGKDVVFTESLVTPSYPAGFGVFGFRKGTLTLNGAAVGALVKSASVTIALPKKTDRFGLNGSGTPERPITNEKIAVSGTFRVELSGLTQVNAYLNATHRALQLKCLGRTEIETGVYPEFTIDIPDFIAKDGIPVVAGADVLEMDVPFTAYANGTDPLATITYVSADTTL